ncbi:helix-turn-helix transcriptional regulator [Catellatospora coxensis]
MLATGETVRRRSVSALAELTGQEAQVAQLAREGCTNVEIAGRLFISPRTVEWHLGKVFTKLGITSRKDLQAAFSAHPGTASGRRARGDRRPETSSALGSALSGVGQETPPVAVQEVLQGDRGTSGQPPDVVRHQVGAVVAQCHTLRGQVRGGGGVGLPGGREIRGQLVSPLLRRERPITHGPAGDLADDLGDGGVAGAFGRTDGGGAIGDRLRFGEQHRAHRADVRTGDPRRFEVAEGVADLAQLTDLVPVQGGQVLHEERGDPEMGAAESGPLEDLLGDPLGTPLGAGAFREGGVQGQVHDAAQPCLRPAAANSPAASVRPLPTG